MQNINTTVKVIFIFLILIILDTDSIAQGCVAIRQMSCGSSAGLDHNNELFTRNQGKFQVNLGYRYFKSFRHFRGSHEETERVANGTEVINLSHNLDLGLSYLATKRLTLSVGLPIIFNDRSSLYEHYGNSITANPTQARFHTYSQGLGDMRISGSYWLINPDSMPSGNIAIGLGVKLPTGNPGAVDDFHKLVDGADVISERPVDQSIQLGDGGVGFSVEVQGYKAIANATTIYYNGFYLINPREVNDVARIPGVTPNENTGYFSVADQFALRTGVSQGLNGIAKGFSVMLGGRAEGIPSSDLIGGSKGFRRPGYVISIEPGIAYMNRGTSIMLNVPFALYRNRIKSYADKLDETGKAHGDAAFADYLISLSLGHWF